MSKIMAKGTKGFQKGNKEAKKKGKNKKTIEKELALELYRKENLKKLFPLIMAQQNLATGIFIVLRKKPIKDSKGKLSKGKWKRVTDPDEIERLYNSKGQGEDFHIVALKDPSAKALKDIFEMLFGKAPESLKVEHSGKVILLDK